MATTCPRPPRGGEAVGIIDEKELQHVLTDIRMPDMNRIAPLQCIRVNYCQIPVATVTSYPVETENLKPDALFDTPFGSDQPRELVQRPGEWTGAIAKDARAMI
ncbi:MAG: hypothetical protein JSV16_04835 [Candidatus Hydrogenedentota bacterium]|nr:MAG: hypothetical protein JSV16_04835 [Candidatus Hydrogenedentota bacterium]